MKSPITITIVVAIIFAGVGFFGGIKYQQSQTPVFSGRPGNGQFAAGPGFNRFGGPNGGGQNRTGFRPVTGTISAVDEKTMTVKMDDGGSKIIILSEKSEINKAETVDKSELVSDIRVMVFGTENSDGSITASNIQLNPRIFAPTPTPVK